MATPCDAAGNSNRTKPVAVATSTGEVPSLLETTKRDGFEQTVLSSLAEIINGQDKLKKDMDTFKSDITKAVEFQGHEIEDLKKESKKQQDAASAVKVEVNNASQRTFANSKHIGELYNEINKLERFTRRNNIRIIGYPESDHENVLEIVDRVLLDFGFKEKVQVERAHRDGKVYRGHGKPRPRNILIKLLRYTDKINIMKSSKQVLKDKSHRFADDLTRVDLEEKRKWKEEVQALYQQGTKLRFTGGMWRSQGKLAPFYHELYNNNTQSPPLS